MEERFIAHNLFPEQIKRYEDNILERIFTSNNDNANEYVVASIGLTKTSVNDMNIKLSLTGFGYTKKRVNVISQKEKNGDTNE